MARPILVTLTEALEILDQAYGWSFKKKGRHVYSKQTIYNAVSRGELTRHGPRHHLLLDKNELLERFTANVA